MKKKNSNGYSKEADLLLKLLKKEKEDISFNKASMVLNFSKDKIADLAAELSEAGYDVKTYVGIDEDDYLTLRRSEEIGLEAVSITATNRKMKIAFISEIRIGAYQAQLSMLHWLYKEVFEREKIDFVVLAGGLTVGSPTVTLQPDIFKCDRKHPRLLTDYVIKHYPYSKRFKTYLISNRRELAFKTRDGINLLSLIAQGRDDLIYAGDLAVAFNIRGVLIKVMAPWDDNSPKGVSYGIQKIIDNMADNPSPHIVVVGGMHERSELPDYGEGVYVYSIPSLHLQMRRQSRKGIRPRLGCLILELNFKSDWSFDINHGLTAHHINLDDYGVNNDCLAGLGNFDTLKLTKRSRQVLEWFVNERIIREGELSRRLNKSKEFVRKLIASIEERVGLKIPFFSDSKRYEFPKIEKEKFEPLSIKYAEVFKFLTKEGGLACTHYGSNHDLPEIIKIAYQEAACSGVRRMFHAGDVTEGPPTTGYRGHQNDVKFSDADHIEDYAFVNWPKTKFKVDRSRPVTQSKLLIDDNGRPYYEEYLLKEGDAFLQTDIIEGNHDNWAKQAIGHRPVRALALRLPDWLRYLAPKDGKISMDGAVVFEGVYNRLTHGDGGLGYTISAKLQKHITSHRRRGLGRSLPTVLWFGHWHVAYILFRDELGVLLPCFKSEDEFHLKRDLVAWVGLYIIEIYGDKNGRLTRVVSNYRNYRQLAVLNK